MCALLACMHAHTCTYARAHTHMNATCPRLHGAIHAVDVAAHAGHARHNGAGEALRRSAPGVAMGGGQRQQVWGPGACSQSAFGAWPGRWPGIAALGAQTDGVSPMGTSSAAAGSPCSQAAQAAPLLGAPSAHEPFVYGRMATSPALPYAPCIGACTPAHTPA